MKTPVFIAFFALLFVSSLFAAPRAEAIVMVKNYTRYTSTYAEPVEYKTDANRTSWESWNKDEETPRYTGWKSFLNLFR